MKTYTEQEIKTLVNKWITSSDCTDPIAMGKFEQWFDKQKPMLPVRDQIIWVRDLGDYDSYYGVWKTRKFHDFGSNGNIICYANGTGSFEYMLSGHDSKYLVE